MFYLTLMIMQRRFRQVCTSLREHSTVRYAKFMTITGFCDLDLVIVKATSPDDLPLQERYVSDLLKIFSVAPSSYRAFSLSFTQRFSKTRCWRVALKCLLLLHRLLRALPDHTPLKTELMFARSDGFLSLYPCLFTDYSSAASDDYTYFIRSYARMLDEALDCLTIDLPDTLPETLGEKLKEFGKMLGLLPQVQSLTDRVMECRPNGAAARSFLVECSMKYIIRDSFICYTTFRKQIVVLLDHLIQMPYTCSVSAFGIYKKAASQANQLCEFYDWCKSMGICGLYEYPYIDRIPDIQIKALEYFLDGMWQLTDPNSSTMLDSSPMNSKEENWAKFEEYNAKIKKAKDEDSEEPLIKLDVQHENEDTNWEVVLEAWSINEEQQWGIQVYNPYYVNPFHQNYVPLYLQL